MPPPNGTLQTDPFLKPLPGETSQAQAARVFSALKAKITADPSLKIGLVYSANNDQAEQLHGAISHGSPKIPDITGGGQAEFYRDLIKLVNADPTLPKGSIRVLPIATSMHGNDNTLPGNAVSKKELDRDLKQIKDHIDQGYQVIGIPGQGTKPYAIGGGYSKAFYKHFHPINGQPQGIYVQNALKAMEKGPPLNLAASAPAATSNSQQGATVYAALNQDLKKIVAAYKELTHKEPGIDKQGITLEFKDQKSAIDFFKGQAGKNLSFDMVFKGVDRRMYSDGKGSMVIGTNKEIEDYKKNSKLFNVDTDGNLSRKPTESHPASPTASSSATTTAAPDPTEGLSSVPNDPGPNVADPDPEPAPHI